MNEESPSVALSSGASSRGRPSGPPARSGPPEEARPSTGADAGPPPAGAGPLTPDDILPAPAYEAVRRSWRRAVMRAKQDRRVSVADRITLVFENRWTVRWQLHEVLHIEGGWGAERIRRELRAYEGLVPPPGAVAATLFIDGGPPGFGGELADELARGRGLALVLGHRRVPARLADPRELRASPVRFIRFDLEGHGAHAEAGPVALELGLPGLAARTELSPGTWAQLRQDLELSSPSARHPIPRHASSRDRAARP